jgi:hypothetical protein
MFCDEINAKWNPLIEGTPWTYRVSVGDIVQKIGDPAQMRPIPVPARDDGKLDLTLQLLDGFYRNPKDFIERYSCEWRDRSFHPIRYPQVRAWMLRGLVNPPVIPGASYFKLRSVTIPPQLAKLLVSVAVAVLMDPLARAEGGPGKFYPEQAAPTRSQYEDIVVALCEIILIYPGLDLVAWPWLWVWAYGGPDGNAEVRTRVFALKALGAIVGRGRVDINEKALASIEKLASSVNRLSSPRSYREQQERQLFASEATALVGVLAAKLAEKSLNVPGVLLDPRAFVPPGTPPPGTLPIWFIPAGAAAGTGLLIGLVLALGRPRSAR